MINKRNKGDKNSVSFNNVRLGLGPYRIKIVTNSSVAAPYFFTCVFIMRTLLTIVIFSSLFLISQSFERTCKSVDIRSNVTEFDKLINCTVIEGSLQVVLLKGHPDSFKNLTFPLLTEVTEYVLIFRVFGLTSLGHLFPNLSVIRGQKLFHNYALVIYEANDLAEVSLVNLTNIVKGAVRIERNSNLCFAETISWDLITKAGKGYNQVKNNKPPEQCPKCTKQANCPVNSGLSGQSKMNSLCWSDKHCQRICSSNCESRNLTCKVDNINECCDPQCIGGCTGPSAEDCLVCKSFVVHSPNSKTGKVCKERCIEPNKYEYLGRRCISYQDCIAKGVEQKIYTYERNKVDQCVSECPAGYSPNPNNEHQCVLCDGICLKECYGNVTIASAADAQRFKGCTLIRGYLEIQVASGNMVQELEESLQYLETITGYLKISRSYPLITLHFFKKLQTIEGQVLDRKRYSLSVIDNQNLEELFLLDPLTKHSKTTVSTGKLFFHLNPRLCVSKIKNITRMIGGETEQDISLLSNGDKISCNVVTFPLDIGGISKSAAVLRWPNFMKNMSDFRLLLGYLIYYKEAPSRNVSMYDGRDACNSDGWQVKEVSIGDDSLNSTHIEYLLLDLKPFTDYAVHVKTYTLRSSIQGADKGGQTTLHYFTTIPATPSQPVSLSAISTHPEEIVLEWTQPRKPNGIIDYYFIKLVRQNLILADRNYCDDPPTWETPYVQANFSKSLSNTTTEALKKETDEEEKCCECSAKVGFVPEDEAADKLTFEDYIGNTVYIKQDSGDKREKRSSFYFHSKHNVWKRSIPPVNKSQAIDLNLDVSNNTSKFANDTILSQNTSSQIKELTYRTRDTKLTIDNLPHFTRYSIEVKACNSLVLGAECSTPAITSVWTMKKANVDNIDFNTIKINIGNSSGSNSLVKVYWQEPERPNGEILAYHLEYKIYDATQRESFHKCVPRKDFILNNGVTLVNLYPSDYLIRIRVTTSAGRGSFTDYKKFSVPSTGWFIYAFYIFVGVLFILFVSFSCAWFFLKRKFSRPGQMIYSSINPEYIAHTPDEWEVCREDVKLLSELGQGSFGVVHFGEMKNKDPDGPPIKCAVKTVNNPAFIKPFLKEADTMKTFDCHHVIKLLGVVSTSQPAWVIMEYMPNGDLRKYLLKHRPDNMDGLPANPPSISEIWRMAAEVADGMAYLGFRKFVHRDLAARNIMVANNLTVKIGDFGMTRDIYETDYYRKEGEGFLPVRWMSPEAIRDGISTYYSDVWSYGIVLYEMATLGAQPYQGLANAEVVSYITGGNILERPEGCPAKLYNLMTLCWTKNPRGRPTFLEITDFLLAEMDNPEKFLSVSFYAKAKQENKTRSHREISCITPLKSDSETLSCFDEEDGDTNTTKGDHLDIKYFPTALDALNQTILADNDVPSNDHQLSNGTNNAQPLKLDENGTLTFKRNNSSDEVKDSKISNGSLPHYDTTIC